MEQTEFKEYIHDNLALVLPKLKENDDLVKNKKMLANGLVFYYLYFSEMTDENKVSEAIKTLIKDEETLTLDLGVDLSSRRQMILIQGYEWSPHDIEQMARSWKSSYPADLFIRWGNERILINHEVPQHEQRDRLLRKILHICSFANTASSQYTAAGAGRAVASSSLTD